MAERILSPELLPDSTIAVIGAGNGGQAMAGFLALKGFGVNLWNRSESKIDLLNKIGGIMLEGQVTGFATPNLMTSDMGEAVREASLIMVTVPASGHRDVAAQMAPHLSDGQIVVLNPGRTGGALEFKQVLLKNNCHSDVTIVEASTFIYASRTIAEGVSHIYGIKHRVPVAALPATRTIEALRVLRKAYPRFVPAENVLFTGFDNIGALFHPLPVILNAGRIESNLPYEHYRGGITPSVARALAALDEERLAIARAFGVRSRSTLEWMHHTYGIKADTLYEAVQHNPGYVGITAPDTLNHRYIFEDVPFSLVPLAAFARIAGVEVPVIEATISLASALHGVDYMSQGRTAQAMGIAGMDVDAIVELVLGGDSQ
jgi:opine dehydrogenase